MEVGHPGRCERESDRRPGVALRALWALEAEGIDPQGLPGGGRAGGLGVLADLAPRDRELRAPALVAVAAIVEGAAQVHRGLPAAIPGLVALAIAREAGVEHGAARRDLQL